MDTILPNRFVYSISPKLCGAREYTASIPSSGKPRWLLGMNAARSCPSAEISQLASLYILQFCTSTFTLAAMKKRNWNARDIRCFLKYTYYTKALSKSVQNIHCVLGIWIYSKYRYVFKNLRSEKYTSISKNGECLISDIYVHKMFLFPDAKQQHKKVFTGSPCHKLLVVCLSILFDF